MNAERGLKTDLMVYAVILVLSSIQFILAFHRSAFLVPGLLIVAATQTYLALMYFMHLRTETRTLRLAIVPATLFVLVLLNMIWADSFRLIQLKPLLR